ncbi:MAG TPA: serine/threonine-protein kinase, partial [Gemmatimonadales bacterium]|nr:serine/threonine-protein kinase [Gemmatimonadales bacterium]
MTGSEPTDLFQATEAALGTRFRLERLVAANTERVLFAGRDLILSRAVSIRVNFYSNESLRDWFLREAEALARLDHPAIRHVYDVGVVGDVAYRIGNWIDGEGLHEAVARGPRPVPDVHTLARSLLNGLEHAHSRGIVVRRLVPPGILISPGGRGTLTDLRFSSHTLAVIPPGERPAGRNYMAPEIRDGAPGDAAADVYGAGAVLYYAITGVEPAENPADIIPATQLRAACPQALERVLARALREAPGKRYLTAAEMLEDFASEAGEFSTATLIQEAATITGSHDTARLWETRLRRALGDDYELLNELGAGGFGRVYRVRDLHLERIVALKVLHPMLTQDPAVVERFRREAQLAARLNHPNLVSIYDIGGRSGLLWYTMEYIEGPNLAQRIEREGPMPYERTLRLLREGLSGLAHAHGTGLVHRDIKPENLLFERSGSLRITDFGLALAIRGQGMFGGATSQSGTPRFASPEQLLGERVDGRSDLYSLAAVGYFALLGHAPFEGSTPVQVLAKQTTNALPDLRAERPDVGEEFERVLRRALRADVNARYPTAGEFLSALNRATKRDQKTSEPAWLQTVGRLLKRPKS